MVILGFDASTSCVGWSFSQDSLIIDAGFIDISKKETNKEKSFHVIETLKNNKHLIGLKRINLEAFLSGFMGGRTSQQVIIKLARFNAIFEYILGEEWAVDVNLVNVSTARKCVLGKAREKGVASKDFVKRELLKLHPEVAKFDVMNKKNNWDTRNSDMYDAAVVSLFVS